MDEAGQLRDRADQWRKVAMSFTDPEALRALGEFAANLDLQADDLDAKRHSESTFVPKRN
jgi:hypothetical protein